MKYLKLFEQFNFLEEFKKLKKDMGFLVGSDQWRDYISYKWDDKHFGMLKKIISEIRYGKNIKLDNSNEANDLFELIFFLEHTISKLDKDPNSDLSKWVERKVDDTLIWNYIPLPITKFIYILRYLSKLNLVGYHFYEFGAGFGIKCLLAEKLGYDVTGFEINDDLIEKSKKIGLGDLVVKKNIFNIKKEELQSPKIIYYYQPIRDERTMYNYELKIRNEIMNKGDILVRFNTYSRPMEGLEDIGPKISKLIGKYTIYKK